MEEYNKNIENDLGSNIDTRHIPIVAELEIRF